MKKVNLTKFETCLVDDEDFEDIKKIKWYLNVSQSNKCYARNAKLGFMHRYIMKVKDGYEVDHINGNTLDNRKCNLRICLHQDNMKNRKFNRDNTSGYKGAWFDKDRNKWVGQITVNGKQMKLGRFTTAEEAGAAYIVAARRLHGRYAGATC